MQNIQEKQKQVLEIFKKMQKKDVFTMLASDTTLDTIIQNAETYDDIANSIQNIKDYIKHLDKRLKPKTGIDVVLGGFYDKFQYHLYDMFMAPFNQKEQMYILEEDYGDNSPITICLKADDPKFSLEERKLLKLINHFYITMEDRNNKMFYIPITDLRRMFPEGTNKNKAKNDIITACERINDKRVSWNFSKTRYATTNYKKKRNLKELKLDIGKNVKLANIIPVYSQCDKDYNMELKGIICKVNKFLELRFWLQQISYRFPTEALRGKLSYYVTDLLTYTMHMNKNQGEVSKTIKDIASSLYCDRDGIPTTTNYWDIIDDDKHKPRQLLYLLEALSNTAYYLSLNKKYKAVCVISLYKINIKVLHNGKPREREIIFNEMGATREPEYMKSIISFFSMLNKRNVTFNDLSSVRYPMQFSYIKLEQIKDTFTDKKGNVDMEKLRAILVSNIKSKWNIINCIDKDPVKFLVKMSSPTT